MPARIKAVLFDMDGVLFDTERPAAEADKAAAQELGIEWPPELAARFIGSTHGAITAMLLQHYGPNFDCARYFATVQRHYQKQLQQNGLRLMPGVQEVLPALKALGLRLAVASSSAAATIAKNLATGGIAHYFETTTGGDEVQNSKPAPDIFIAAAKSLSLAPAACAAVEDSYAGVRSACAAGCTTVMVPDIMPATAAEHSMCAAVLENLSQLPAFLGGLV